MEAMEQLETIAQEVMGAFAVDQPPVPVEIMLQQPRDNMWDELDVNQLSGTFLSVRHQYSPRMSLARLLARHIAGSDWGKQRGLKQIVRDEDTLYAFARMIVMPRDMVNALSAAARNPTTMSMRFEVPEDDARQRLQEMSPS